MGAQAPLSSPEPLPLPLTTDSETTPSESYQLTQRHEMGKLARATHANPAKGNAAQTFRRFAAFGALPGETHHFSYITSMTLRRDRDLL